MKSSTHNFVKKIRVLFTLSFLFVSLSLVAQVPQAFKYQAVLRDSNGMPYSAVSGDVRISILSGDFAGVPEYVEVHNVLTSPGGLITLNIGTGVVQEGSGAFSQISWGSDDFFVKVEIAVGGANYIEMGTSQLLSVPYALFAKETSPIPTVEWSDLNGSNRTFPDPSPGIMVYVSDRNQMAYFDGGEWRLLVGCPDNTIASAGVDSLNVKDRNYVSLAANTPGNENEGTWSVESGAGGSFSDPSDPQAIFTGIPGSDYTLRWTISTICESNYDEIEVSFCYTLTNANAGPDQQVTNSTTTTLAGNVPGPGNTGSWSIVSGSNGVIDNPEQHNSGFSGQPNTTYVLRWTIIADCQQQSQDDVTIFICPVLTVANAGPDQLNLSTTGTQLNANAPGVGNTGLWTIQSGAGGSIDNPSNRQTQFTGLPGNTYVLRWRITNTCNQFSSDFVSIGFCPSLVTANAGADAVNVCGQYTLQGNAPGAGNTAAWVITSGAGGQLSNAASPNAQLTGQPGVTYILTYTISNACGSSSDNVSVAFEHLPSQANAGADQLNINGTSTSLDANIPNFGSGSWSIISGSGGSFANDSDPKTQFTGQPNVIYNLAWTITNLCNQSTSDNVSVGFCPTLVTANAGADVDQICGQYTLQGNAPGAGNTAAWVITSGAGGQLSNPASPNAQLTGQPGVTYILNYTISNACGSSSDNVSVAFDPQPTTANAGPDQLNLQGTNIITLAANQPAVGTGAWSVTPQTGAVFGNIANPVTTFTGAYDIVYTLTWTISTNCYYSSDNLLVSFLAPFVCGEDVIDERDLQVYPTVQIGDQCWMAKNLNVGTQIFSGGSPANNGIIEKYCYDNQPANCQTYGGLYFWNEAMNYTTVEGAKGICPDGWRIPTDAEWQMLFSYAGDSVSCKLRTVGSLYWDDNECATDIFGFDARGAGQIFSNTNYLSIKSATHFWTSTPSTSDRSWKYALHNYQTDVSKTSYIRNHGLSVRCIKLNQ